MARMYIGIDIGGTSTRAGLFQSLDSPDFALLARFPTYPSYEQQLQALVKVVRTSSPKQLAGIGISIGGRVARDGVSLAVAPNLPAFVGKPFAQDYHSSLPAPYALPTTPFVVYWPKRNSGTCVIATGVPTSPSPRVQELQYTWARPRRA